MTVNIEHPYSELAWTGAQSSFATGIQAQDKAHIAVSYLQDGAELPVDLVDGVHLSLARDPTTELITGTPIAMPPPSGVVRFERTTPAIQGTDFANLTAFAPAVHTRLHDAAALRDQELGQRMTAFDDELAAMLALIEAALSLLQQTMPIDVPEFASRTAVANAIIDPTVKSLRTRGYALTGDGGDWPVAIRIAAAPVHPELGVRSQDRFLPNGTADATNGGWWELVSPTWINVLQAGAKTDGSDSTAAIQACIAALSARGGVIVFPRGTVTCAAGLDFDAFSTITLRGQGGSKSNANPASVLLFTGTGVRFIDCRHAQYCWIESLAVVCVNEAFNGVLLDYSGSSALCGLRACLITNQSVAKLATLVSLDGAILWAAYDCYFTGGRPSIHGRGVNPFSNDVAFHNCLFQYHAGYAVVNGGRNWLFSMCTWEPNLDGKGECFINEQLSPCHGITFVGCSTDDIAASGTAFFFQNSLGVCFVGGRIAGHPASIGISLGNCTGAAFLGVYFENWNAAIEFVAATCNYISDSGSYYDGVTSKYGSIANLGPNHQLQYLRSAQNVPLALADGIAAPAAVAGLAHIWVDAADGDLKVRFGDGITKTIAVDT
jgi:hypothetical protein